jgi:uncharacterized membrane protein
MMGPADAVRAGGTLVDRRPGRVAAALVGLQVVGIPAVAMLTLRVFGYAHMMDPGIYYRYATSIMQGLVPYRDFAIEYPPLALLPILAPRALGLGHAMGSRAYHLLYLGESVVLSLLITGVLLRIARRAQLARPAAEVAGAYAGLALLMSPILPWRFDLFPTLATVLALAAVLAEAPLAAGVLLGIGIAAKVYPIVLLPVFGALYLARREWAALVRLGAGAVLTVAAALVPWLIVAQDRALSFVMFNRERGLQVESVGSGLLLLAHKAGLLDLSLDGRFQSIQVIAPAADAWASVSPALLGIAAIAVTVACFLRFRRDPGTDRGVPADDLAAAVLLMVATFVVCNKVFSPQYMIWLLPFAGFLRRRQLALMTAIAALTTVIAPPILGKSLVDLRLLPIVLLNVRNAALVALAVDLFRGMVSRARAT